MSARFLAAPLLACSILFPGFARGSVPMLGGGWAIQRPDGSFLKLALGSEATVQGDVVVQPAKGLFGTYDFTVAVEGRAGSKFRIAWRSADPVWLKYADGYDTEYRKDSKLTDLASSVVITLRRDGIQKLEFAQATGNTKASNCGVAGCSFSETAARPFLATSMTVTQVGGASSPPAASAQASAQPSPSGWQWDGRFLPFWDVQQSTGMKLFAQLIGDKLVMLSVGPARYEVHYAFDVGDDKSWDPGTDVNYSWEKGTGQLCPFPVTQAGVAPKCRTFASSARLANQFVGDVRYRKLEIPFSEVNRKSDHLRYWIQITDTSQGTRKEATFRHRLHPATLAAARGQAPAGPAIDHATSEWFVRAPNGVFHHFLVGRSATIGANLVEQPVKDFFSKYYFTVVLSGNAGQKYRIAWQAPEAVNLEGGSELQVQYPPGSLSTARSKSITVTLGERGHAALSFWQLGKSHDKTGWDMSKSRDRPFLPTTMTVTRAN